jgi:hypothetical protein
VRSSSMKTKQHKWAIISTQQSVLLLCAIDDGWPVNEAVTAACEWSWCVKPVSLQLHVSSWFVTY